MDSGWVKLHRKIEDNYFLMQDNNACLLFLKLLIYVNSNGEYAVGRRALAERANLNHNTVYKILVRLEAEGLITIESKIKYSIIRINNWKKYQMSNRAPNQLITDDKQKLATASGTTREPHGNHTVTTREHYNKNKNKELEKEYSTNVLVNPADSRTKTLKEFLLELMDKLGYNGQAKVTDGRLRKLKTRLKTHGPQEILTAATNLRTDDYMQGDNDSGKKFGTIDYLLRSDENVDKYITVTGTKGVINSDTMRKYV